MTANTGAASPPECRADEHTKLATRLLRLRDAACEAILWDETEKLSAIAKSFSNITPTKEVIAETGVGHLLSDKTLWRKGGAHAEMFAERALREWKQVSRSQALPAHTNARIADKPLADMKADSYLECVNRMDDWIKSVDQVAPDPVCSRRLAAFLVQHGFRHCQHLDSVKPESLKVHSVSQAALLVTKLPSKVSQRDDGALRQ